MHACLSEAACLTEERRGGNENRICELQPVGIWVRFQGQNLKCERPFRQLVRTRASGQTPLRPKDEQRIS